MIPSDNPVARLRWMLSIALVAASVIVLALLTSCVSRLPASDASLPLVAAGPGAFPERQIVVTIRDSNTGLRAAPGSTARAYSTQSTYQASAYARRVIASLEHDYPLDWVAGWRIDLLNVHCVVFLAHDQAAMRCSRNFAMTRAWNRRRR
jgi:hypothetical protein